MSESKPWGLTFWDSPEWTSVKERLKTLEKNNVRFNPSFNNLFNSLSSSSPNDIKVVMVGQDPYPDKRFATGYAFSIQPQYGPEDFPQTLKIIFKEYSSDLGYPTPNSGDLTKWRDQGVFLWNALPSVEDNKPLSHDWSEYDYLTREVLSRLAERGIVFCLLGQVARRYLDLLSDNNEVILTSHPSPRGVMNSKTPFIGSRIFSTINDKLCTLGYPSIDWRLE